MRQFELQAQPREKLGKSANRRLRRGTNSRVPAILYGGNQKPLPFSLDHNQLLRQLKDEAFYSHILTIHLQDQQYHAVLKEIQRHPWQQKILHLDFLSVTGKEKINLIVPLHFVGEENAPGVKQGGIVLHKMTQIEVRCLPTDLPEYITVDLSKLDLEHSLHVSDLQLPPDVEFTLHDDRTVVSIQIPKETQSSETPISAEVPAINVKENAEPEKKEKKNKREK